MITCAQTVSEMQSLVPVEFGSLILVYETFPLPILKPLKMQNFFPFAFLAFSETENDAHQIGYSKSGDRKR